MKIICTLLLLFFSLVGFGQNPVRFSGELLSDHRLFTQNNQNWAWNENRLDLNLEHRGDRLRFRGNVWLRHLGPPEVMDLQGLYSRDKINPWNLNIREAFFEVRGFLSDNVDLKLGRQLISWGTADYFNPTSMLNPFDLEDALDFGRRNGSFALNLTWFLNSDWSLQGVYIPFFSPGNLPLGAFAGVFDARFELPEGLQLGRFETSVELPAHNLSEGATLGFRLKGLVGQTDISLSYIYGREFLPFAHRAIIRPAGEVTIPGLVDLETNLFFPRFHMAGIDMAGTIGNVGVWAEAGLFFPEREIKLTNDFSALQGLPLGTLTADSLLMEKKPYPRFVVGADYTFGNGTYMNIQYLHGFMHERGQGNQNDYLIVAIERNLWGDQVLLRPVAGGFVIEAWQNINENFAFFYTPSISFRGIDNLEINLGAFIFAGRGQSIFAGFKEMDMITASARVSF